MYSRRYVFYASSGLKTVCLHAQLDPRYFRGLDGQYSFSLQFRLEKEGEEDYIIRSRTSYLMQRSVNTDITLDPGRYFVLMKITAYRNSGADTPEDVVRRLASERREKLVQIGLSYDLAHAKGVPTETEQEKREREEREESHRIAERNKLREETMARLKKEYIKKRKLAARQQRQAASHSRATSLANSTYTETPIMIDTSKDIGKPPKTGNGTTPVSANGSDNARGSNGTSKPPRPSVDTHFATDRFANEERELLDGFEFDSDIDMPPEEHREAKPARGTYPFDDQASCDPWNAVCVVGLKVYSKDRKLSLQVVRAPPEEDTETALDCDDPAASATTEKGTWFID